MIDGGLIVTGGSRGIGAAIARLTGSQGTPIVVNYASARRAAEEIVAWIQAGGGKAVAVRADIRHEEEILRLFNAAAS